MEQTIGASLVSSDAQLPNCFVQAKPDSPLDEAYDDSNFAQGLLQADSSINLTQRHADGTLLDNFNL